MLTSEPNRASRLFPFAGGIAGKLGDRFETKWVVKKLFEVLRGAADALQFEFVDPVNHGIEFWLVKDGRKEWYQTKKQNTDGNWTIRRLEKEGVLATAHAKLSASSSDRFFFVSETSAKDLDALTKRATAAETYSEFQECLTDDERNGHAPTLQRIWNATPHQTFRYLKRIGVLTESEATLDIDIQLLGGLCFSNPYNHFYPLLREYLENNFNRELTTELVRCDLVESGYLTPCTPLDPTLRARIERANQNYLDSYIPFGISGSTIPRQEAQDILSLLDADNGPSVILLTGTAGTGKSGVIRQILRGLNDRGTLHLAFRVDKRLNIDSSSALGQTLYGRDESPFFTLQALSPDTPAILLIDQIDAISEISGRTGAIREVVFEFIRLAKRSPNFRIIAACRSYDLANDRALREVEKDECGRRVEIKPLDWAKEIEPLLQAKGIPYERISPKQRQLLTLPLNLVLFLETSARQEQPLIFQSTADLFDRLVSKKQRDIRGQHTGFNLMAALSALASRMSQDQTLDAPDHILDFNTKDILATENLVVYQSGRVSFFHESLFDYAFARSFVAERSQILDWLTSDEQHLFRRTQIRQILAMYRQDNGARRQYLTQLRQLLSSPDVRYHLKDAVARWLGGVESPTEAELDVILSLDFTDQCMPVLVRQMIYPQTDLLPILLRRGSITLWLNSGSSERQDDALNILRNGVKRYPVEVAQALRAWWQENSRHSVRILGWFSWLPDSKLSPELLSLNLDLIRSKPAGLFDDPKAFAWHSMSNWIKYDPEAATKILQAWFQTWYEVFPEGHPFEHEHRNDLDYHWLGELQKESPVAFLNFAIPAFTEAIRRINLACAKEPWKDYTWRIRYDRVSYGAGRFISLIRQSLATVVLSSPTTAIEYLTRLDPQAHPATLFLWLETIAAAGESLGQRLPLLLGSEELFNAGPNGAQWLSFARAAKAALPYLSSQDKLTIESHILKHWPELDRAKKLANELAGGQPEEEPFWTRKSVIRNLQWSGYEQWCCLKAIGIDNLTSSAKRQCAQLDRKFIGKSLEMPSSPEARLVPPPIGTERSKRMSDSDWLNAIAVFREDRESCRSNGNWLRHTGSQGLAGLLRERTKENPERFASLLHRLPLDTLPVYFNEILNGIVEGCSSDEVIRSVISYAHALPDHPCCEGISRLLQQHPTLARDDGLFAVLCWYVKNGPAATDEQSDQQRTQELIISAEQLVQRGGFTSVRSGYRDRGTAIEALAAVIWECPDRLDKGISLLLSRIEEEPLQSLRCFLVEPIYSVLCHDRGRAANLLKQLVMRPNGVDLLPLSTYDGVRSLYYLLHDDSDTGPELLDQLLTTENEDCRLIGAFHLFREAYYNDVCADRAKKLAQQSGLHRKLAAHAAAIHLVHAEYRTRAEQQLAQYFDDPIKEIRSAAAECFQEMSKEESIEPYRQLIRRFICSQAFDGDNFWFFRTLLESAEPTSEEVILSAERILILTEQLEEISPSERRSREMHHLDELLLREYRATEDCPALRSRILDILDKMLLLGLYGTDKIIEEHERI